MPSLESQSKIERDRTLFFSTLFNPAASASDIICYLVGYTGPIFSDQKHHLQVRLQSLFEDSVRNHYLATPIIDQDDNIDVSFLQTYFPNEAAHYFEPVDCNQFKRKTLLEECTNELRNETNTKLISPWSNAKRRQRFDAYITEGRHLFVSPHGYQYFDQSKRQYFPAASHRNYATALFKFPRVKIYGAVVMVQDRYNGSNFAHFTFDWIPRILYALENGLVDANSATFVMGGGAPGPYHIMILSRISEIYKVPLDRFFFPTNEMILEVQGDFIFFSDQVLAKMHPAQRAHPSTIELLRNVTNSFGFQFPKSDKIFISRADAKLRQIGNEDELINAASRNGFRPLLLSKMSIIDQISMIGGASEIVGAHGMGFSHIIFNRSRPRIVELFHPTIGSDDYYLIAKATGLAHAHIRGIETGDSKGSYQIDVDEFYRTISVPFEAEVS